MPEIELGDIARDTITGFEGVVIGKTNWLHNCTTITLQPKKLKDDGSPQESKMFDAPQLELVESKVQATTPATKRTGGSKPEPKQPNH